MPIFRHRSAVIKALQGPMQPVAIKKRALEKNARLRMSANNVRDVIRELLGKGVVQCIEIPGQRYVRYELTKTRRRLQVLHAAAEGRTAVSHVAR